MINSDIAASLEQIAFLLLLKGENQIQIQNYLRVAKIVREMPESLEDILAAEENLAGIRGIGRVIAKNIEDLIILGEIKLLQELKKEFPISLMELNRIKGLPPETIVILYRKYGVTCLKELRRIRKSDDLPEISLTARKRIESFFDQ